MSAAKTWGHYGRNPPCEHLLALRAFLVANGLAVWAEHSEGPNGWVNVGCDACQRTYEVTLRAPWATEGE